MKFKLTENLSCATLLLMKVLRSTVLCSKVHLTVILNIMYTHPFCEFALLFC